MTTDVLAQIQIEYSPNTCLESYRYTKLLGKLIESKKNYSENGTTDLQIEGLDRSEGPNSLWALAGITRRSDYRCVRVCS
jgi:hypothetical protein